MMATKAWCDVSILLNIFNITHLIIFNYRSQQWTTWWYTYSNDHVFNRHVAHICYQTTFLLSLEGRFLVAKEALKVGEVIISEVPLFDGNTEAEKSRQVPRQCFGEGGNLGPMILCRSAPPKKRPQGWRLRLSPTFLVGNPEVNYKPSLATVLGGGVDPNNDGITCIENEGSV